MEKYSSYKDSGFEWMGQIPSHWETRRFRFLLAENSMQNTDLKERKQLQFRYGDIVPKANQSEDKDVLDTIQKYTVVAPGDIMINGLNLNYDFISQRVAQVRESGVITSAYISLRPLEGANSKYYTYYMKAMDAQKMFHGMGSGVRLTLSYDNLKNLFFPYPSPKEQEAIVAYLDAATAKIDEAIAQQQRMIDLLSERKQIIIDKTTTKGAFSGKELHDSGVDYIGEIPEGWTTTKIKFVASYNDEVLSEDSADKDIEYVEIGDVQYGKGITGSANYLFKDAPSRARRITRKGDIIVSTVRTYLKAVAVIKKGGLIVSTGFVVIRPKSNVDAQFLAYAILNSAIISEVEKNSVGTSYPAVNAWEVVDIKVPIPPIEEQKRIALYLSEIEKNTEKAIEGCGKIIQALQERKQIIINDVVTGKVKVV